MIERTIKDYVALDEMFGSMSPEEIDKVKAKLKVMIGTEEYSYLKYEILKRFVHSISYDMGETAKTQEGLAYLAEAIIRPPERSEATKKSHFRG